MRIALIDNGSLAPEAHRNLRRVAAEITAETKVPVEAVSWKLSDRIPAAALEGAPAATLKPWLRRRRAEGESRFLFIPFFISPEGAVGDLLRSDLESLQAQVGPFSFGFTAGLATALPYILAARVRETIRAEALVRPAVIAVDHGGPSRLSAEVRDAAARALADEVGRETGTVIAASMEGAAPLLRNALAIPGLRGTEVVVVPLFLSPGRHAGAGGDLARIAAQAAAGGGPRCHFAGLVGTHPLAVATLSATLLASMSESSVTAHP